MKSKSLLGFFSILEQVYLMKVGIVFPLARLLFFVILIFVLTAQLVYSHHLVARIPVINSPMEIALEDNVLYVSNLNEREISMIDAIGDSYLGKLETSSGVVAVQPVKEKNKIYIAKFEGGIDVHDLTTRLYQKTIEFPYSDIARSNVYIYPQQLVDRLTEGATLVSDGVSFAYDTKNGFLYITNYSANNVAVIDTDTDTVTKVIPVARHPIELKVDSVNNKLLVISLAGNTITFISLDDQEVITETSSGNGPWGVDIDETDHRAYVTHRASNNIGILDMATNELVGEIPISESAHTIVVDDERNILYVSLLFRDKILQIDADEKKILQVIDTGIRAWNMVHDPKTDKIYSTMRTADKVFVFGPDSISIELPVVIEDTTIIIGKVTAHSQGIRVTAASLNLDENKLVLDLIEGQGNDLAVRIPRAVLDHKEGSQYKVFVDGNEIKTFVDDCDCLGPLTDEFRQITFEVALGAKTVEIVGTDSLSSEKLDLTGKSEQDLICKDKVWIENNAGKIVCVTPSTAKQLIERGWGRILE